MIHTVSTANVATYKTQILGLLTDLGLWKETLFTNTSDIVFTLHGYPGVFKYNSSATLFYGTSWVSGATLANEVTLLILYNIIVPTHPAHLISGEGFLGFTIFQSRDTNYSAVLTKDDRGVPVFLSFGSNSANHYTRNQCYQLSPLAPLNPALLLQGSITDEEGYFLAMEVLLKDSSNRIRVTSIPNVKIMTRLPDIVSTHALYGDDVAIQAAFTTGGVVAANWTLLLKGGRL